MEELPFDRAALEHLTLWLVQLVEPRREQRPQRRRHLGVFAERRHLGQEERIAAGGAHDPLPRLVRHGVADERASFLLRQRLQAQHGGPARTTLEELRPGHAEKEQWRAGREQRGRLDELEEGLLPPLDVVEDDHERRLLLEQLAERPGDLVGAGAGVALPEQRPNRGRRRFVARQRADLLHHLDDRPVGDPLAVGETAAAHDPSVDPLERLGDEPRLADAGVADDRHELAAQAGERAIPGIGQLLQLALAADEAGGVRALGSFARRDERMAGDRLGLALQLEQPLLSNLHRGRDERERFRADQYLAGLRRLLQARSDIDRVTGGKPLLGAGQHLAGVDSDPALDAELRQRFPHLDRGAAGAEGVVLVGDRHPEDRHHRVSDELLHRAAVRLDDSAHPLEVGRQQRLQRLGIDRLSERGRADDVAEQHGHDLAVRAARHESRLEHERRRA